MSKYKNFSGSQKPVLLIISFASEHFRIIKPIIDLHNLESPQQVRRRGGDVRATLCDLCPLHADSVHNSVRVSNANVIG